MKAIIFDIQRSSFVDGDGIRTTVFFKGCNLKCKWCHNPESVQAKKQLLFYGKKCGGCKKCQTVCPNDLEKCDFCGRCALYCPNDAREICGREYSVNELFNEIIKDKSYYDELNGGVTFSGGECMLQIDFLEQILKKCKEAGINTAIDTAGNVPYEYFERIIPYTDTFLYDIKCITPALHKEYTSVSNEQILSNVEKLSNSFNGNIIIRIPIIGGFNDSDIELLKIKDYLSTLNITRTELLPYHNMGEHKYEALNKEFISFSKITDERMDYIKKLLAKKG